MERVLKPRTELILMIFRPAFCCRMIGRTALVVGSLQKVYVEQGLGPGSLEISSAPASRPVPHCLTRTSILPVHTSTLSTAVVTDVSSVTSQVTIVIPSRVSATARRLSAEHAESSLVQRLCGGLPNSS